MEIEFTLEKADLLEYARFVGKAQSRPIQPRMKSLVVGWVVVLALIIVSAAFLSANRFSDGTFLEPLLLFVALLLWLYGYVKMYLKRYLNIYYSNEFFPDLFAPQKIVLNPDMLVCIRLNTRSEVLWNGINEIAHTEKHTFILLPNKTGYIVPHRIFRNSTEIQGFKDVLEPLWNSGKTKTTTFNASTK